jgi:F-type H+-transporting ATPase subunit a
MILLIVIIFLAFGIFSVRKFSIVPGKFQAGFEMVYESIIGLVEQIVGDRNEAKKIFPIIGTILVYFAVANVISLIPGLTDITYNGIPIFRTPTSDINTALGVSIAAVIALNIVSLRDWGLMGYLGLFLPIKNIFIGFKKGFMDGFVALVDTFVGVLNIVGEIAKIISLSFRLFGNVYAGQVLAIIIMSSFSLVLPAVWTIMSGFTGLLQGMVFASLVAVYYTLALKPSDDSSQ